MPDIQPALRIGRRTQGLWRRQPTGGAQFQLPAPWEALAMRVEMFIGLRDHEGLLATLDTTGKQLQPVVVPFRDPRFLEVAIGDDQPLT